MTHSTHRPMSAITEDDIAVNSANWPILGFLFDAGDLTVGSSTEWVDRISGITVPVSSLASATNGDVNARDVEIAADTTLTAGSLPDLTGKDVLIFAVGSRGNDGNLTIGKSDANVRLRSLEAGGTHVAAINDGSNSDTLLGNALTEDGTVAMSGLHADMSGNMHTFEVTESGGYSSIGSGATTNVSDLGAAPDSYLSLINFTNVYCFGLMVFDDIGSLSLEVPLEDSFSRMVSGDMTLWPLWKNRSL